jgi:hypothetical protein
MASERSARVDLVEKVRFVGRGHGDQEVVIDYPPPLGDDAGLRGGLQLLLMALAACMEHPTVLTEIRIDGKEA